MTVVAPAVAEVAVVTLAAGVAVKLMLVAEVADTTTQITRTVLLELLDLLEHPAILQTLIAAEQEQEHLVNTRQHQVTLD
jgi:mannitol/fructose-specific phosphotransferase system IIA component (Ntr-type)